MKRLVCAAAGLLVVACQADSPGPAPPPAPPPAATGQLAVEPPSDGGTDTSEIRGEGTGISDDICAVMISLDVRAATEGGAPVRGAEVWEMNRLSRSDPNAKASRLGYTSVDGHLSVRTCYLGSSEFAFWRPDEEPVVVELLVFRDGGCAARVRLQPDTGAVLRDGNLLGVSPEEWQADRRSPRDPSLLKKAFELPVQVTLPEAVVR